MARAGAMSGFVYKEITVRVVSGQYVADWYFSKYQPAIEIKAKSIKVMKILLTQFLND